MVHMFGTTPNFPSGHTPQHQNSMAMHGNSTLHHVQFQKSARSSQNGVTVLLWMDAASREIRKSSFQDHTTRALKVMLPRLCASAYHPILFPETPPAVRNRSALFSQTRKVLIPTTRRWFCSETNMLQTTEKLCFGTVRARQ